MWQSGSIKLDLLLFTSLRRDDFRSVGAQAQFLRWHYCCSSMRRNAHTEGDGNGLGSHCSLEAGAQCTRVAVGLYKLDLKQEPGPPPY